VNRKVGKSTSRGSYPVDFGEETNSRNQISSLIACSPKSTATTAEKFGTLQRGNERKKARSPDGNSP